MEGNDRFEGFAVDLMTEIAKVLKFNVTFKLVEDNNVSKRVLATYNSKSLNINFTHVQYGSYDEETGRWNGAIKEVLLGPEEGGADFAVLDLSVTSQRAKDVTFSMPFMNLGICMVAVST